MADPMPPLPLWKRCSGCKAVKPIEDFSIDRRVPSGRQSRCLACVREYKKRYRQADREHYLDLRRQEYERRRDAILSYQVAYRQANRERILQQVRERFSSMTEEELAEHRKRRRVTSAAYRTRHYEEVRQRINAWVRAHPDKRLDAVNRRRALKKGNGAVERVIRSEIGERDGWICGICLLLIDKTLRWPDWWSQSLDHIVPLALGGEHTSANCRIAHLICNIRRGTGYTDSIPPEAMSA